MHKQSAEEMKKEDWVKVDVITCAAPDLRKKSNMHARIINNGTYMNDPNFLATM